MKVKSFDETKEYELLDCPFCGSSPDIRYIGNHHTKKRKIEIYCSKCRIKRTDAAMKFGFVWLEEIAVNQWNQRTVKE